MNAPLLRAAALIGSLVWLSDLAVAQAPPPPPASPTLWSFLGIPQASYKINAQLFNRRGNHPALEKKPPLKGIADPANLKAPEKVLKVAAEIKQSEDLKPQKIKAIKYLAMIGCGCYDKAGKVTDALIEAMDDCTEEVRLAAVNAISTSANGEYCTNCKQRSCCNEKIVAQLSRMANERDDQGCFIEPSERVREAASEALGICCADHPGPIEQAPTPIEGSDRPAPIEGGETPRPPQPPSLDSALFGTSRTSVAQLASSRRVSDNESDPRIARASRVIEDDAPPRPADFLIESKTPLSETFSHPGDSLAPVFKKVTGSVLQVNLQAGVVHLHLHHGATLPPGSTVKVYHQFLSGSSVAAVLRVIDSRPGEADARPISKSRAPKIARGDVFEAWH